MTQQSLSVVIPAYNAAADIGQTLEALAAALGRAPTFAPEVVLVDDGSTDGTSDAARDAWTGEIPLRIVTQGNRGRFLARLTGLHAATAEWILLLDSRVTLHADALAYVAARLGDGAEVWNGHVHVLTAGNPYGAFWKVLAELAWKDYFASPRPMSYGREDFDRYPKGTTCFLTRRETLRDAMSDFRSHYRELRFVNDDTIVIRRIAERFRIHLAPAFACEYKPRSTLRSFVRHAVHRGTVFVDGHLHRESRFFAGAVAFFPLSVALGAAMWRRPALVPVAAAAGGVAAGAAAASAGCTTYEIRSVAALAPVYAAAHGAGMWRGLALLARDRLRAAA